MAEKLPIPRYYTFSPARSRFFSIYELLYGVCKFCTPREISRLGRTCRGLRFALSTPLHANVDINVGLFSERSRDEAVALTTTLGEHGRKIKNLTLNGIHPSPHDVICAGYGAARILEIIGILLPTMDNLISFQVSGKVDVPPRIIEGLSWLPRLRTLGLSRLTFYNVEPPANFKSQFPSLYSLSVGEVTMEDTCKLGAYGQNLATLDITFSSEASISPRLFAGYKRLTRLRVAGGVMEDADLEEFRPGQVLRNVTHFEVRGLTKVGWLAMAFSDQLEQVIIHDTVTSSVERLLEGIPRSVVDLRIVLKNETLLPDSMIGPIQRQNCLTTFFLDGFVTSMGPWESQFTHMQLTRKQWTTLASSLQHATRLGIRPLTLYHEPTIHGSLKLSEFMYPILPELESLHLYGCEHAQEEVVGMLHVAYRVLLHDMRLANRILRPPKLREIFIGDENCYSFNLLGGLDEMGGMREDRLKLDLVLNGTEMRWMPEWSY